MFSVPKLQGNFEAKEHSLIILQNHDPEMCRYIFISHLKGHLFLKRYRQLEICLV